MEISFQNMNVLLLAFSIMALLLKLLRFSRLMRALLPGLMILLVGTLYYYELELCHNFLVGSTISLFFFAIVVVLSLRNNSVNKRKQLF